MSAEQIHGSRIQRFLAPIRCGKMPYSMANLESVSIATYYDSSIGKYVILWDDILAAYPN
ncbi:hypothetical protein BGZ76_008892, partial [Entomortierella beljakovae]